MPIESPAARPRFAVGLTGGIGSGKSLVADMFAALGAAVIDTDQIAHQLTAPEGAAIPAIRTAFGKDFLAPSGAMDRPKMRECIFTDPGAKNRLEAILHPLIWQQCIQVAASVTAPYVIFVVPLLIESPGWHALITRILVVDSPEPLQIMRVMKRSALSEAQVLAIMATQATRQERVLAADDVILNQGSVADLVPDINRLHGLYTVLSR